MGKLYLGIDQGTTVTTALLMDEQWNIVGRGHKEHRQIYPHPGWVEHDPLDIYNSCLSAVADALAQSGRSAQDIYSFGLDHQGETCLFWDVHTGQPLYNAIVWQDRRTSDLASELKEAYGERFRLSTGLLPDSYYSATKWMWMMDNIPGLREGLASGRVIGGTLNTWLLWKFSNGRVHITDACSGVRTMLMNLEQGCWDSGLLELTGIPEQALPTIHNCNELFGYTDPDCFLGARVALAGSISDSNAGLIGGGSTAPGTMKISYGSGTFISLLTGERVIYPTTGPIPCCCWKLSGRPSFSLSSASYVAGSAVKWLRDGLRIISTPAESEVLARAVDDCNGVSFVPAFAGLATPYWDQYARGCFLGLTGSVTREHMVRAVLESVALQNMDGYRVLKNEYGQPILRVRADGGMVDNGFLMQFQSDLLGVPIEIPAEKETAAFGSAFLGALSMGDYDRLSDLEPFVTYRCVYEPQHSEDWRRQKLHDYHRAVERSLGWAKPEQAGC